MCPETLRHLRHENSGLHLPYVGDTYISISVLYDGNTLKMKN